MNQQEKFREISVSLFSKRKIKDNTYTQMDKNSDKTQGKNNAFSTARK
jgi:hypothetical protein